MTPMMVVPMLRKIGFCGHMTCVGLLMTQPGPELTLFPLLSHKCPSCEADVALLRFRFSYAYCFVPWSFWQSPFPAVTCPLVAVPWNVLRLWRFFV